MLFSTSPSACQPLSSALFPGMSLWIKRDDQLHPLVSGNKFRKLKYPLQAIQAQCLSDDALPHSPPAPHLVSMGGIWSNHLHALAHAAALSGLPATALVRGAEGMRSAMLDDCRQMGMQIRFVTREAYRQLRQLRQDPAHWQQYIAPDDPQAYVWLPEGGSSPEALHGVAELVEELPFIPDTIVLACGTGATLAGILAGLRGRSRVIGIPVVSQPAYLHQDIARLLQQANYPAYDNYQLSDGFQHGGYAKTSPELLQFCAEFIHDTGIAIEPVYTGKMLFAVRQLWLDGFFHPQERVVAIHTGGLQGARGFAPLPSPSAATVTEMMK
ncbi:1-aminocyclopropane-1-carboxylate deaminase/D-cysteine desulfhydrase [Undibacterium sp. SXout7W]|uniref:1-aminocyclopropane-1-carboxylate deaminase/D-cysteine desulfhydrase n=1 Tax=Undibacterium sp. SXout7W TaxID=3413049 RepID=UPI003BF19C1D